MRLLKAVTISIVGVLIPAALVAQSVEDALRYSLQYPSFDPVSMVIPGVAHKTGFGAFQENPASMALFEKSFGSFSLSHRNVNEETGFLGINNSFDASQAAVGDLGLVYKVPTVRGSLVVGGGYSQSTDFNRAFSVDARNNRSTLTDFYNITADDALYNAAFNVYAVDWADVDSTFTESIFRIGFPVDGYPGINQDIEVKERGDIGEFSAFIATEFQPGLMVGASIGVITGSYNYDRQFLETDSFDDYNGNFIDTDGDGTGDTDIDRILSIDNIDAEITSFTARLGTVYRPTEHVQLGLSYQFKNTLNLDETYNTVISTTFDNGDNFEDEAPGEFSYKIERPARFNTGLSLVDLQGLTISASAEHVDYGDARLDFGGDDLEFQNSENDFIKSELRDVWNLRVGLEYKVNDQFTPRVGYAYYPSPQSNLDVDRRFFSGGFSAKISRNIWLDVGAQYSIWDDQNRLYFFDNGTDLQNEVITEDVRRLHVMGGLKIGF